MKIIKLYLVLCAVWSSLVLCQNDQLFIDGQPNFPAILALNIPVKEVSKDELKALQETGASIKVVNVLGQRFYDDCHIKGSIAVPLRLLWQTAQTWDNKKETIVVYCACKECDASAKAFKLLTVMGFENVYAYEGGIREWYKSNLPCAGPCQQSYLEEEGDSYNCIKATNAK